MRIGGRDTDQGSAADDYLARLTTQLDRMMVASVALTAAVLAEQGTTELTFLGWRVLLLLGDHPAGIRLSELADELRISRPSATKLVQRLVARDMVETALDKADRRARRLRLTWSGAQVRESVLKRRHEIIRSILPEDVSRDLVTGLATVADRVSGWSGG